LDENLVGVYLHGSLACGCFNPERSDLDLLVITKRGMSVETKRDFAQLLLDGSGNPYPIETSFLTTEDLKPWRHPTPYDFRYSEDWRKKFQDALATESWRQWNDMKEFDEDLAGHITITHDRGVRLYGPPIEEVFPPVPTEDYAASIVADLKWARDRMEQYPVYGVLNHCRVYAFLAAGLICSKNEGALWALGIVPEEHREAVTVALQAYRGERDDSDLKLESARRFTEYIAQCVAELHSEPIVSPDNAEHDGS